jgi:hypothetical protein
MKKYPITVAETSRRHKPAVRSARTTVCRVKTRGQMFLHAESMLRALNV